MGDGFQIVSYNNKINRRVPNSNILRKAGDNNHVRKIDLYFRRRLSRHRFLNKIDKEFCKECNIPHGTGFF